MNARHQRRVPVTVLRQRVSIPSDTPPASASLHNPRASHTAATSARSHFRCSVRALLQQQRHELRARDYAAEAHKLRQGVRALARSALACSALARSALARSACCRRAPSTLKRTSWPSTPPRRAAKCSGGSRRACVPFLLIVRPEMAQLTLAPARIWKAEEGGG